MSVKVNEFEVNNNELICCFCESVYSAHAKFCGKCNEYKGLMPIALFDKMYG